MRTLKDLDAPYLARRTYELEQTYMSLYDKVWTQPIISKCVLTIDSKTLRKALAIEVTSDPVPDAEVVWSLDLSANGIGGGFIPTGSPKSVRVDASGNRIIFFRTALLSRFDKELSGAMTTLTGFVISPSKQVSKDAPLKLLHLNTATSLQLVHEEWRLLLVTGRGYSRFLDEIEAYKELPDGLIEISAKCTQGRNAGTWNVVVDPKSSYVVRQARYYRPNEEKPIVKLETEGTITKGSFSMPKKTTWEDHYLGTFTASYAFKDGRFDFDEATYRKVELVVKGDEPYPPGALVSEGRVDPEEHFQADSEGKKPSPFEPGGAVGQSRTAEWLSFIAANFVVTGLFVGGFLLKRRWLKK